MLSTDHDAVRRWWFSTCFTVYGCGEMVVMSKIRSHRIVTDESGTPNSDPREDGPMPSGDDSTGAIKEGEAPRWFSTGVASVGAASFLSDSGHEITTSLLPTFFTSVLHGSAAGLGAIEGVSDALMGVAKLISGPAANSTERRRRLAVRGYLGTAVATGAIGLATGVWQLGVLRSIAWASRGVRSPSRDALLAQLAPTAAYGRAYGLERAGDNLGAVAGPLLAAFLVGRIGIRPALWCAAIPSVLATLAILIAAREARRLPPGARRSFRFDLSGLRSSGLARPFVPIAFFEFGNMASTLLIFRATQLLHSDGRSLVAATSLAIVIYAGHNAFAAGVSLAGGHWIDRSGPRVVFAAGALLYVLSYVGFAIGTGSWFVILISFILAGSGIGLSETCESALVAQALPDALRGTGFGVLGGVQASGDIVSSVTVGILYVVISPVAAFIYAAGWMLLSLASSSWLILTHAVGEGKGMIA